MRRTRVVIADRHPVTLQGLSRVLGAHRDFEIVAHCGDGATCIKAIRTFMPDIAIVDLPIRDMARLANSSSENARTRLVFFTSSVDDRDLRTLVTGGVHTVIPK